LTWSLLIRRRCLRCRMRLLLRVWLGSTVLVMRSGAHSESKHLICTVPRLA
jgi:hypothetical protein